MAISDIDQLIKTLAKLPGLGPRSARRMVLYLLGQREQVFIPLLTLLKQVNETVTECPVCGNMDTQSPCHICQDEGRSYAQLCVVQDVTDLWALERAGVFKGRYHVLGGLLSALDGIGPEELKIQGLLQKIEEHPVQEVILALPSTMEGQTTIFYLMDALPKDKVKITVLSRGVPLGSELDYLDEGTLQMAFTSRS